MSGAPLIVDATIGTAICVVALVALVVAFVRRRKLALDEERELRDRIDAYRRAAGTDAEPER